VPLLPQVKRNPRYPGRPRLDDRKVLNGILFVLYTGIRWEFLPQELGYGSGMTCWRRLRDWNEAGVWQRLHELLLAELRGAGLLAAITTGGNRNDVTQLLPLIGGSSKERSRCCTGSDACASAGRSATTSITPSSPSAAPSSAGDDWARSACVQAIRDEATARTAITTAANPGGRA
jgi:transposase